MNDAEVLLPFEHFHRYAYAAELVRGKRVLDLACREGYGTRMLAEQAQSVIGMDPDEVVIQEALGKHKSDNLMFVAGSVLNLPSADYKGFDAVVLFEGIEEGIDPSRAIDGIKQLLAPGGFLFISVAQPASGKQLFATKTFGSEEFYRLIESRFGSVERLVQRLQHASTIEPAGVTGSDIQRNFAGVEYLMAIASDATLPEVERSTMAAPEASVLRSKDKTIRDLLDTKTYLAETAKRHEKEIAAHKRTIASLQEAFAWHTSQITSLTKTREFLDHAIDELRTSMASDKKALEWRGSQVQDLEEASGEKDKALAWRTSQVEEMEQAIAAKDNELAALEALRVETESRLIDASRKLAQATEELTIIHMSAGWKFVLRMRSIRMRLLPDGTLRYRLCKRIARMVSGG